jgi:hypothetical protein
MVKERASLSLKKPVQLGFKPSGSTSGSEATGTGSYQLHNTDSLSCTSKCMVEWWRFMLHSYFRMTLRKTCIIGPMEAKAIDTKLRVVGSGCKMEEE